MEPNYTSIDDIPPVRSQQCLWIDVPGVSHPRPEGMDQMLSFV